MRLRSPDMLRHPATPAVALIAAGGLLLAACGSQKPKTAPAPTVPSLAAELTQVYVQNYRPGNESPPKLGQFSTREANVQAGKTTYNFFLTTTVDQQSKVVAEKVSYDVFSQDLTPAEEAKGSLPTFGNGSIEAPIANVDDYKTLKIASYQPRGPHFTDYEFQDGGANRVVTIDTTGPLYDNHISHKTVSANVGGNTATIDAELSLFKTYLDDAEHHVDLTGPSSSTPAL